MKSITVFTPTYNRAYCLNKLYESLCRQSSTDFCWLVIDDGSTDNTKVLIEEWIKENRIEILYVYKRNGGMHTGYNEAYEIIETELNVCMDSDDFMTDDAIEKIITYWRQYGSSSYAGIVALDATTDYMVLGKEMPDNLKSTTLEDLYNKHKVSGDKKLIYRTEVVKSYPPYPEYEDEKLVPLGSLYLQIDKDFELLCMNEVVCIVEYMEDGSTRNIYSQYLKNPKGFLYSRLIAIKFSNYRKVKFTNNIHLWSHCLQLKSFKSIFKTNTPFLTVLTTPLGLLLYFYVKFRNRHAKS